jgi:hypothetical protein
MWHQKRPIAVFWIMFERLANSCSSNEFIVQSRRVSCWPHQAGNRDGLQAKNQGIETGS